MVITTIQVEHFGLQTEVVNTVQMKIRLISDRKDQFVGGKIKWRFFRQFGGFDLDILIRTKGDDVAAMEIISELVPEYVSDPAWIERSRALQ